VNEALTSPCRIWSEPTGVLSTKKNGSVRGHPLRVGLRVLWQKNAIRNRLPLKERSQRHQSRTRFLNNPPPESRRRNLRSNCGLRASWPREARRRRDHWSPLLRQGRLRKGGLLQRRGLRPRRERSARKLGRKNWRRKGGGRDGRGRRCRHLVRPGAKSCDRGQVVDSQASSRRTGPWSVCRFLTFLGLGRSFETPKITALRVKLRLKMIPGCFSGFLAVQSLLI
jgi:hypothetical protein